MARLRLGYTKSRTGCLRCRLQLDNLEFTRDRQSIPWAVGAGPASDLPKQDHQPETEARTARVSVARRPRPGSSAFAGRLGVYARRFPRDSLPDPFPYLAKFTTGPPEEDADNWVFDLELLHNFTTSTYTTFQLDTARHETYRLWQVEVPKQAFVHVFLLHQILAISSYHLAYLNPQRRQEYALRASQHQNAGIRRMRAALGAISDKNCHALFASSSLLFIGALAASSTSRPDVEPTVDDLVDVMILVKGVGSVLNSSHDHLHVGPLSELFIQRGGTGQPNPALDRVILAVEDFLVEIAEHEPDARVRAVIHAEAYRLVTTIRDALVKTSLPEYRVVAAWPIQMSEGLIPLLRQRNQAALALLSYYCVVFHAAELQGFWFMQGWSSGIIKDVAKTIDGGNWKKHSAWALGWITGHATMG